MRHLIKFSPNFLSSCSFLLVCSVTPAFAQADNGSGQLTDLMDLILAAASHWDGALRHYAITTFWALAAIQLVWTFFPLLFKQADFGEIVGELVKYVMVTGFFLILLTQSVTLATAIIDSFRQAGGEASGLGKTIEPGDIFYTALQLGTLIMNIQTWNPLSAVAGALAAIFVVLGFSFIAAFMALTIIESYIVINASVIFMGFGASQWTREYTLSIVRYAVSVGAKLFILTLLVGIIVQSADAWASAYNQDNASMWTLVGLSLVCAYLCRTIPDLIQGVINGTSSASGHHIGEIAAAAAAGAAAGAVGASGAAGGAIGGNTGTIAGLDASLASGIEASQAGHAGVGGASPSVSTGYPDYPDAPQKPKDTSPKTFDEVLARRAARNGQNGATKGDTSDDGTRFGSSDNAKGNQSRQSGREIANGSLKFAGLMASISVPGMASAAGLSLGPSAPKPTLGDEAQETGSMEATPIEADNIIRGADTGADVGPQSSANAVPVEAFPESAVDHQTAVEASAHKEAPGNKTAKKTDMDDE